MTRPTIPQVIDRFRAYKFNHPAWGELHTVLRDGYTQDVNVRFCIAWAVVNGDEDAYELALILLEMSRTQRRKLAAML